MQAASTSVTIGLCSHSVVAVSRTSTCKLLSHATQWSTVSSNRCLGSLSFALFQSKGSHWGRASKGRLAWKPLQVSSGQGGGRGFGSKRPDRTSKKGGRRGPKDNLQNRNGPAQPPSEFLDVGSSGVATETEERSFNERLKAIKAAGAERPKPEEVALGPIDYEAPAEKPDEQPTKPWVKAVSIAGALIFLGSFALSDLVLQNLGIREKTPSAEVQELPKEEKERLQKQAESFEATLQQRPGDAEALEGAGVSYAEMGDFKTAADYLDRLVKARPNDIEALRLLAETKYAAQDYSGAAYMYRCAIKASPRESLGLLKGLADALISDKRPNEAVGEILNARERIRSSEEASGTTAPSEGTETEGKIDPVQVELLLAKAYQSWGKAPDALSVYDRLIDSHPDDFRPYLAKGILLKQQKQEGEADRNFIKARFLAPEAGKQLVDRLTGRS